MPQLEAQSFDAVICDEPYGTTNCPWDAVIPFDVMWSNINRLSKLRAPTVLFGSQPFTSLLIASNLEMFRYEWVWDKRLPTGYLDANRKPLKRHENIVVFCEGRSLCNPIMRKGVLRIKGGMNRQSPVYGKYESTSTFNDNYYPTSIIEISGANQVNKVHSTEKPLLLMEYLVKTYTNPGDTVLDFCAGSGTTLRACKNLGRRSVGIEMLEHYCQATVKRLAPAFEAALIDDGASLTDLPLFAMEETR